MDKGRLEKLQAQAKAATELAARLQILQANDPKSSRFRVRMEDGALGNTPFDDPTLRELLSLGRAAKIQQLERELEVILGVRFQEETEVPLVCDCCRNKDRPAKQCGHCMQIVCAECEPATHVGSDGCTLLWPHGDGSPASDLCPVCGMTASNRCRCPGPHSMEDLVKGHGLGCDNNHRWSHQAGGVLVYDQLAKAPEAV